ncbi:MAG: hypothetical protein LBN38_01290, partial [Verrucomicrobiota bacterium]|nr:hypothetical protein [Verrucomicrobiota bacterium]
MRQPSGKAAECMPNMWKDAERNAPPRKADGWIEHSSERCRAHSINIRAPSADRHGVDGSHAHQLEHPNTTNEVSHTRRSGEP